MCSQSRDSTTSVGNFPGRIPKPVITNVNISRSADQAIIQEVRDDIADLAKRFDSFQHDLHTAFSSKDLTDAALSTLGSVNSVSTTTHASSGVKPGPYAAAISSNILDIVKCVVATSIRENKAVERGRASVAIHNLNEHENDVINVQDLFDYLECNVRVIKVTRLGRVKSSKKPRLLRVELATEFDRDILLRAAKYLKDDSSTPHIYITQWLQPEELTKLKSVQDRCHELNRQSHSAKGSKRKYVVISGKIMQRVSDGSIRPFKDVSTSAPFSAVNNNSKVSATSQAPLLSTSSAVSPVLLHVQNVKGGTSHSISSCGNITTITTTLSVSAAPTTSICSVAVVTTTSSLSTSHPAVVSAPPPPSYVNGAEVIITSSSSHPKNA